MLGPVELLAGPDECRQAPCRHGNIVESHACYCHDDAWKEGPRKCPVWRHYGIDPSKWFKREWELVELPMWDGKSMKDGAPKVEMQMRPCMPDDDLGGCPHFVPT